MRMTVLCLSVLLGQQAIAEAPECPTQPNRSECLRVAQTNYMDRIKFLEEDNASIDDRGGDFLMAANDVRHFETQACHKTCIN